MARHTAKSHKIRKVEILVIQIINCLEEKGYAAVDCDNQIDMVNREKVEDFCKTAEKEEQAAVDIVQPNRDSLQY